MPSSTAASANAAFKRRDKCSPSVAINSSKPSQAVKKYSSVYKVEGTESLVRCFSKMPPIYEGHYNKAEKHGKQRAERQISIFLYLNRAGKSLTVVRGQHR